MNASQTNVATCPANMEESALRTTTPLSVCVRLDLLVICAKQGWTYRYEIFELHNF